MFSLFFLIKIWRKNYSFSAFFIQLYIFVQIAAFVLYLSFHEGNTYLNAILGEIDFSDDFLNLSFLFLILSISAYFILNKKFQKSHVFCRLSNNFIKAGSVVASNKYFSYTVCGIWPIQIINSSFGLPFFSLPSSFIFNLFSGGIIFLHFFSQRQRMFFWVSFMLCMPIAILYGARGLIMYPLTLYLLGRLISSPRPSVFAIKSAIFYLPLVLFSSVLAIARYAVRGNENFSLFSFQILFQAFKDFIGDTPSFFVAGLEVIAERVTNWPVLVGVHLNGFFNGRGFSDFFDELLFAFFTTNIGSDVMEVQQRIIDSNFLYGAVSYLGYQVSIGWTVPLNLLTDGVIRLGLMGGAIYWILFLLTVRLLEVISFKTKIRMQEYIFAYLPGLIFFKLSETHTILVIKNIVYFIITLLLIFIIRIVKSIIRSYQKGNP
jgi:hypothetical protein